MLRVRDNNHFRYKVYLAAPNPYDLMRKLLIIFFVSVRFMCAHGQTPVGTWSDHLKYNTSWAIASGDEEIYSSNGLSLLVYNKTLSDLRKLSRINGLSETGISAITWSEPKKMLIVAYLSGGIDLIYGRNIYYLSDIIRKSIPDMKIARAHAFGNYCYLCCSFGIVVVDLDKKEIHDTWKPASEAADNQVFDVAINDNVVYAATEQGLFSASLNDPGLSYYRSWKLNDRLPVPAGKYISVVSSGSRVFTCMSAEGGDKVYAADDNSTLLYSEPGVYVNSIDQSPEGFTISSGASIRVYNTDGSLLRIINSYGWGTPAAMQAVVEKNNVWIADAGAGLVKGTNMTEFTALTLPGPATNDAFHLTSLNGRTIVTAGGTSSAWNSLMRPLKISVFENNSWAQITSPAINDPMRALIDPADGNHFFVSSWGGGLLEYRDQIPVKQYDEKNSPLQASIPGTPSVRICGIAMDENRNLWITQSGVQGSLKVLKPDGTWITGFGTINAPIAGDLIIDRNGFKWIILPGGYGLYIFDDNKTPEIKSDDRAKVIQVRDDKKIASNVYSIAADMDGNIWTGTDQGPFIYSAPEEIFRDDYLAYRIRIPRNDGSNLVDYMLGTETITSIAIDGGNRKWIGTKNSGVYLLSSGGTNQLLNFNEENSPLLSNTINSISVDNKTGDVWIGSSKGLQSYRGNATEGGEKFSGVYSFPNPVREDYEGNLTITGLVRDTNVKITDVSGNLVFETISDGGSATWDLKNYRGKKVSTGVYLAFCSSPDGKQAIVTKILVIH